MSQVTERGNDMPEELQPPSAEELEAADRELNTGLPIELVNVHARAAMAGITPAQYVIRVLHERRIADQEAERPEQDRRVADFAIDQAEQQGVSVRDYLAAAVGDELDPAFLGVVAGQVAAREAKVPGLVLETKTQAEGGLIGGGIMITPPLGEDYWEYRVRLSDTQAVVGFPKFGTIGIGFAAEEDWNANLPYTCGTEEIYAHIQHNKGDESITRADCLQAIRMIQDAASEARTASRR
jgi:hypothetical protein